MKDASGTLLEKVDITYNAQGLLNTITKDETRVDHHLFVRNQGITSISEPFMVRGATTSTPLACRRLVRFRHSRDKPLGGRRRIATLSDASFT